MKDENVVKEKSFEFSVRIVNLYKHLTANKQEYVLSKQLLRAGTSIGAYAKPSRLKVHQTSSLN